MLLAAVDFETTGRRAGYHEPIQLAVVPLAGLPPFHTLIKPRYPHRAEPEATAVHGISPERLANAPGAERAADLLINYVNRHGGRLLPIAHNWAFEYSFLNAWLGPDLTGSLFHPHARDTMQVALAINDASPAPIFQSVSLASLCRHYGINNDNPHDALADARAEAELYQKMLGR